MVTRTGFEPMYPCVKGMCVKPLHQRAIKWWAWGDLNLRPHAYQACALTTWATSPLDRLFSAVLHKYILSYQILQEFFAIFYSISILKSSTKPKFEYSIFTVVAVLIFDMLFIIFVISSSTPTILLFFFVSVI